MLRVIVRPRTTPELIVLHEHPEWQKPLFAALERRGVPFEPFDVTGAAFSNLDAPQAPLYFNEPVRVRISAGNTRAVPLALAYINANSNLRPSVAAAFGFDPYERAVDFVASHLAGSRSG